MKKKFFFRLTTFFFRNKKILFKTQRLFSFLCIEKQKKFRSDPKNFRIFFLKIYFVKKVWKYLSRTPHFYSDWLWPYCVWMVYCPVIGFPTILCLRKQTNIPWKEDAGEKLLMSNPVLILWWTDSWCWSWPEYEGPSKWRYEVSYFIKWLKGVSSKSSVSHIVSSNFCFWS